MAKYIKTSPKNKKDTKMKTTYKTANNNIYDIYKEKGTGRFYIKGKDGKVSYFQNPNAINTIKANKPMTIWKDGPGGYNYNASTTTKTTSGGGGGGSTGGGGYVGGGGDYSGSYWDADIAGLKDQLEALAHPKVWTPDELAELYGVKDQYNMDYLLKQYNDATNKYYTDAIATQEDANTDAEKNNSAYASSLLRNYINSYANSAPTAVGKGTLAANALSTQLGADKSNEEASANLNSILNSYKEAWDSELKQNDLKARKDYNNLGTWLLNQGTALNASQVQNYINGYANSAPTAVGKGTLAANALSTQLGADKSNEEASANLNSIINSYKEAWNSELAQNDLKARQDYNNLGTWLLNQGTALNASQVQNYINELKALETYYAAARNAQSTVAQTAASAYQQNANAALANNSAAREDAMRQIYRWKYGENNNNWQKAYNQTNKDEATKYINNVSAY